MIFFTAFILSLFLTQIGRAVAQVGHDILSRLRLLTDFNTHADELGVQSRIQQRI